MANTTPIVTIVTKTATKERTPNGAEAASINIIDFCEEHYEDILPVMDKIRRDKRKEVHTRLDFGENSKKSRRMRQDSQNSSAKTLSARYRNPSKRPQIRDRLRNNDGNVFDRLGQRQSAFKRFSNTYSPSTTKSGPDMEYSRDGSYSRGRPHKRDSSPSRDRPRSRERSHGIVESYGNTYPSYRICDKHRRPRGSCEKFSSRSTGRTLGNAYMVSYVQLYPHKDREAKKYVKDPIEIHNIKQKDRETIEDFMKRFKVETGRMKGALECMRISGFMHGVNNLELTKRLNEHVPKTVEEMMIATTAFIRGETVVTSKKKVHTL
nr:reverse transcriptase domain-containing protein [Tanacetum cinerariifolium]